MKNVGELVRDYETKPVIVIAELGCIDRRVREHDNAIARECGRISIHVIDVVRDYEIDFPPRCSELSAQLGKCTLGIDGPAFPYRLQSAGEVNVEV
jgi:hypothetical protein